MGAPKCFLLNSMDILITGLKADKDGEGRLAAPIPQDPRIVGATLYCQWAAVNPKANAFQLAFSQGLEIKIQK